MVNLQKALNENEACEKEAFRNVVYSMCATINEIKASLDQLHNKVDLIDKKINALLELVVEIRELVLEMLYREIEENLVQCRALTSLYLPASFGGRLETVEDIIRRLINQSIAAGIFTGDAESYLKQGLVAYNDKDFCQALQWFMAAYRQLTKDACCQEMCYNLTMK